MKIIKITDKKQWNSFIEAQPFSQFLQSWEWGEFHKKMGRRVWRVAVVDNTNQHEWESESARKKDATCLPYLCQPALAGKQGMQEYPISANREVENILMAAQIIKYKLPFGQSYLYSPRGPVVNAKCKMQNAKLWNSFLKKMQELAQQEKCIFFRLEPMEELESYKELEFNIHKVKSVQPENEWLLNLEKAEGEILKEMQQKTRYNIRLAEKKGVKVRTVDGKDDFDKFWDLISDTYNRKQIRTHLKEYYKGILEIKEVVKLWLAEYEGKIIAANIISYFGDMATYMHGGADYEMRNLMSPYLLQWEAIKDAKDMGYSYYNFGGCSEINSYWQGITRFKKGFGGFELEYPGTYEIKINTFLYGLYSFKKSLRR